MVHENKIAAFIFFFRITKTFTVYIQDCSFLRCDAL